MDAKTIKMIQFMRTFAPSEEKFMSVAELEKLRQKGMVYNLIVHPTAEHDPYVLKTSEDCKIEVEEKTNTPQ